MDSNKKENENKEPKKPEKPPRPSLPVKVREKLSEQTSLEINTNSQTLSPPKALPPLLLPKPPPPKAHISNSPSSSIINVPQPPPAAIHAPHHPLPRHPPPHHLSHHLPAPQPPPAVEHAFLTDVANVRQMEQGLMQLLDDFHLGKLQAFGENCSHKKMEEVRERQERLARLHFEFDNKQDSAGTFSQRSADQNMSKLLENLDELCQSIHNLQSDNEEEEKKET